MQELLSDAFYYYYARKLEERVRKPSWMASERRFDPSKAKRAFVGRSRGVLYDRSGDSVDGGVVDG